MIPFFFPILVQVLSADVAPRDAVATIHSVNTLLLSILTSARSATPPTSCPTPVAPSPGSGEPGVEHVPWTASVGPRGVRTLLLQQHSTTVQVCVHI